MERLRADIVVLHAWIAEAIADARAEARRRTGLAGAAIARSAPQVWPFLKRLASRCARSPGLEQIWARFASLLLRLATFAQRLAPPAIAGALGIGACLWAGGALYLAWAGLDAAAADPLTLVRYGQAYGAARGEAARVLIAGAAPFAAAGLAAIALVGAPGALFNGRHVHGRARWGGVFDMARDGLFSSRGLILGEAFGTLARDGGDGHVLIVAPTGAGKTSGVVIPNLLSWTGSTVTLDPKREAWAITAGWRAAHGEAFLWAPLDAQGRSCRFNPLDQIAAHARPRARSGERSGARSGERSDAAGAHAPSPRRVVDLMKLAAALIPEPENDTRWIAQSAQRLFRALALYVLDTTGVDATIGEIWRIVSTPDDLQAWCHLQAVSRRDLDPACIGDLSAFAGAVDKERAYILNELQNALQPWSSALVRAATAGSDFALEDLRRRRIAIYLALDPGDMAAYGKLLRMFVELAADALMRGDDAPAARHDVLLAIDEFATFGRLPLIEKLMSSVRGYGARIMVACQALSQIDDIYGVAGRNAMLGNATRQLFMASPDPATSAYVSRRIGDATIETRSRSRATGGAGRASVSAGLAARTFLKPEEFERIGAGRAVLLSPGAPPCRVKIKGWFSHAAYRRRRLPAPDVAPLAMDAATRPFRAASTRTHAPVHAPGAARAGRNIRPAAGGAQGDLFTGAMGKPAARNAGSMSPRTKSAQAKSPDDADQVRRLLDDAEALDGNPQGS